MKRLLAVLLVAAALAPLLAWGGFRLWLQQQPPEFRAQVEQFSTIEFLGVLRDFVAPPPFVDRGTYGRRVYPDRSDSPWVRRSALDGRPRMLAAALAPELRVAYSAETATLYQFWRGDIDYTGPVYDAAHGFEPTSRGIAYLERPATAGWWIETERGWEPARVRWYGHGFDPASGGLWLRYSLSGPGPNAETRMIEERPERELHAIPPAAGLERRFALSSGPRVALEVGGAPGQDDPTGLAVVTGAVRDASRVSFDASLRRARLVHRFDAPRHPLAVAPADVDTDDAFARHDCHSCHNERERVVGPAWSEVALRYAGANRAITIGQLGQRIREGGGGAWGDVAMTPHPEISRAEAATLAALILDTPPSEPPVVIVDTAGAPATWTFESDTEAPPDALHPSITSTPIDANDFTPKVGGLGWLPDGRLAVSTWDRDGSVFAVAGWDGPPEDVTVTRIAEGLHEPLGLTVLDGALYVMQKQEITRLLDHDGDDWVDEYRTIADDWAVTSNFHEFGFGLVGRGDDLYASLGVCVLTGGKSCRQQTPDRGHVIRASIETGEVERVAGGLRTPNGLALAPDGELFVTDNQGDWLPASKLIRVRQGESYGWRPPGAGPDHAPATPPALWLPQNEVGNSPTQPLFLEQGPYAGQVLFGDIFNGGLKRAVLEEIDGVLQGVAFHFSGGFEAPINRLLATPDGGFVVGQVGSRANWGESGKDWFGLEVVRFADRAAFEPRAVSLRAGGFEIELTRPLAPDAAPSRDDFTIRDWYYVPSEIYGGPKYALRDLPIDRVSVSLDRRRLLLDVSGLEAGRVVYLRLDPRLRSAEGETLWVNEAWYTLNKLSQALPSFDRETAAKDGGAARPVLSTAKDAAADPTAVSAAQGGGARPAVSAAQGGGARPAVSAAPPNTLDATERAAGWRLLFDGVSFDGWKIYGAEDDRIEHWVIDDAALHFTRDVSFAGLAWNHLNPFSRAAIDLMTVERFGDFELSIDWRISEGGNSGIFYLVPDESTPLSWDLAPEMQVLDDAGHGDGEIPLHRAGDLYDLQSLARGAARPVGEWNTARIRVEGDRIRHWLNDVPTADIVRGGPAWNAALADSKFAGTAGWGMARRGHIALQDHGDPVWFRNIKIRPFD